MKNLPLLLLGAGAVYFIAKKPDIKTSKKESSSKEEDTQEKETPVVLPGQAKGYNIDGCKLTIYNKQKAYAYAFKLGADNSLPDYNEGNTWSTKPLKKTLVGDCISSEENAKSLMNTKEKAFFIFELFKNLYSGITSKSIVFEENAIDSIQQFKNSVAKVFGYDVSDFKVEIIKK